MQIYYGKSIISRKGFNKRDHIMRLCIQTAYFSQEVMNDNDYLRTQQFK